jgi:hypothetical protein
MQEAAALIAGLAFAVEEMQADAAALRASRSPPQPGGMLTSQPC